MIVPGQNKAIDEALANDKSEKVILSLASVANPQDINCTLHMNIYGEMQIYKNFDELAEEIGLNLPKKTT